MHVHVCVSESWLLTIDSTLPSSTCFLLPTYHSLQQIPLCQAQTDKSIGKRNERKIKAGGKSRKGRKKRRERQKRSGQESSPRLALCNVLPPFDLSPSASPAYKKGDKPLYNHSGLLESQICPGLAGDPFYRELRSRSLHQQ